MSTGYILFSTLCNTMRRLVSVSYTHLIAHKMNIGKMAEATIKMVTESIDSFVKKDLDSAAAVVKYDNVVDDLSLIHI